MIQDLSGQFQDLSGRLDDRFDRSEGARLAALIDPITRKAHTEQAKKELAKILSLRAFDSVRWRKNIQELLTRVSNGDLVAADEVTKNDVRYWTARLCAADAETLDQARQIREELSQTDPEKDLSIVDALLAESDGDQDKALRLLRDRDDSDSRTVLFGVLRRSRGEKEALAWHADHAAPDDGAFFTAAGWSNWAFSMARVGQWEEAALRLRALESHWNGMPALAIVEGVINAALLLPGEYREMALNGPPLYQGIRASVGENAQSHHSRATACFEFAEGHLEDVADDELADVISRWRLWLRLMDPTVEKAEVAKDDLRQRLGRGAGAVNMAPFAYAFHISYDGRPLRMYLEHRRHLGGLNDQELLTECLLAQQSMTPRDLVKYLERHKTRLVKVMPTPFQTGVHVDALLRDGQIERARALVTEREPDLDEGYAKYLIAKIDAQEGHDPRKQLEDLYDQTRSQDSLVRLVAHLKDVDDRASLLPLVRELFKRQRTVENAHDIVRCLSHPSSVDHESIIKFLETNSDLLVQSDHLKAAKAWALYYAGRFQESRALIDKLLDRRIEEDDVYLDINVAVSCGDWERLATIVDREWPRRDSHGSAMLITLAQLAGQQTQNPDRALQLVRLAAKRAPNDPQILAAAYWLHFRLGRDDEADLDWLTRASELSSSENGPLWRIDLKDVVTKWLPERQADLAEVQLKWLRGELPMSLAANSFNVSLARLLLHGPELNAAQPDARRRATFPIVAGGRNPIEVQKEWTLGLDLTSIMVLDQLGLLEITIKAIHHVKIAPDVMVALFREKEQARFHQPSRVAAAKQLREFQNKGGVKATHDLIVPPASVAIEVGHELATLLQTARQENGAVICALPIYKAGSLLEQRADTVNFDDLIISTIGICTMLYHGGKIDADSYRRASAFLQSCGQTETKSLPPANLYGPIYVDRSALSYLQDANVLRSMVAAGLDVRVSYEVVEEMNGLIEAADVGDDLTTRIEGIRNVLRAAVESGAASFLPRTEAVEHAREHDVQTQATLSLLAEMGICDALCIDDRFINHHLFAEPQKRSTPIICMLDLLRYLVSQGDINAVQHWTARHGLRQGGFAFIPLDSAELLHWLKAARFNGDQLTESLELRVLRQTAAQMDSLDLTSPAEALALTTNVTTTCRQVIVDLWEDASLTAERAATLSEWVWRNLAAMAGPAGRRSSADGYMDWVRTTVSLRLGNLFLPMTLRRQDRRTQYARWLERSVLPRLQPANSGTIAAALSSVRDAISTIEGDQRLYDYLFLEQLPEGARRRAMAGNADFAGRCGFETKSILRMGLDIELENSVLFAAVREVFATSKKKTVRDIDEKEASVDFDKEDGNIVVNWSDTKEVRRQAKVPELALLSPIGTARVATLGKIIERLGPTATDFRSLLADVEAREVNDEELTAIFDEVSNGVATLQARLGEKVSQGSSFAIGDIVPDSLVYFERFAGPLSASQEPEFYISDVLVTYRKELLKRDLSAGLDICCLGALRDDLTPGRWVAAIDDETVWGALSLCQASTNPFSLLAALDVALYRGEDPRFQEFAADAVAALSDEGFERHGGVDTYRLLAILAEFVLNRVNLLENAAIQPGYWKRMCAWMQAGVIARAMIASLSSVNVDALEKWTQGNMVAAGVYAGFLDARNEPMLFAGSMKRWALRSEVLGRLQVLKSRHEAEGRQVPRSEEINRAITRSDEPGQRVVLGLPGPLEGHIRPTEPIPQNLRKGLGDASSDTSDTHPLQQLVMLAQLFALGELELESARETVKSLAQNVEEADRGKTLGYLEFASTVAAAGRDTVLAERIADAVIGMVPGTSEEVEILRILPILLLAAGAHETHDAWFKWLEEKLEKIAMNLPQTDALQMFRDSIDEIETVLPIESWFHIRARTVALAGAA